MTLRRQVTEEDHTHKWQCEYDLKLFTLVFTICHDKRDMTGNPTAVRRYRPDAVLRTASGQATAGHAG